jgi:thioester reductase-like protein
MYTLLTGATGLLGRYLMRDLLMRQHQVAVLVRPQRRQTAQERVDAALGYWERAWKRTLPRPIVFEGDISQPNLGLDQADQRWLAANCQSVIHSAASLTFYEEDGEPWRSNVEGVERVLRICRDLELRRLYHVSTAYTCGLRDDTVYESELDVGQDYGNDYESSKAKAEKLVRQANFLDTVAIFRPSIIVGDIVSGFSSTFHGFYTPLRLACALQSLVSHEHMFEHDFLKLLGLSGDEGKNLVPVDWVSRALVSIIERRPQHSETYALTSHAPISVQRINAVIREVSGQLAPADRTPETTGMRLNDLLPTSPILAAYIEQLYTYRSYWRNDPRFDCSNTQEVVPDMPCPVLDDDGLIRLAKWAADAKFSAPVGKVPPRRYRIEAIQSEPLSLSGETDTRVLTITGCGGGCWTIYERSSGEIEFRAGRVEGAPELCIRREALERVLAQEASLEQLVRSGEAVAIGHVRPLTTWQALLARGCDQSCLVPVAAT